MRNLVLALMAGMLLFALSCGGGGNPVTPDLAGLEGTWDYVMICDGVITGPGGSIPFADTSTGFLIIDRNSIVCNHGDPCVWSYNGSRLTMDWASSESFSDPDCGDVLVIGTEHEIVALSPGATVGNITGTISIDFTTEFCGDMSGVLPLTGNMTKR